MNLIELNKIPKIKEFFQNYFYQEYSVKDGKHLAALYREDDGTKDVNSYRSINKGSINEYREKLKKYILHKQMA